jgi:rubrerythrin
MKKTNNKNKAINKIKKVVKTVSKKPAKSAKKVGVKSVGVSAKPVAKVSKGPKMPASSLEVLSHFQCGKCAGWWSIGDAVLEDRSDWFCPWCGIKNVFDK